jgi:hypothetical protein
LRIFCEKNPQSATWCRSSDSNLCFPPHCVCDSVSKLMDVQEKEGTVPGVVCRSEIVYGVHSSCLLTWAVNKGTLSIFHQTHIDECPAHISCKTLLVFLYSLYRTRVDVLDAGILRYIVPKRRLTCVSGFILDKQLRPHCLVCRFLNFELTSYTLTHTEAVRWKTKITSYPGYSVKF